MKHRQQMLAIYLSYAVIFIGTGFTMYTSKYLGELGLSNTQIGLTTAVPALVALFAQPVWGMISDRSPKKKYAVIAGIVLAALFSFGAHLSTGHYVLLLTMLTLSNTMFLPAVPVSNAIAMEYTAKNGGSYGPVRMSGTIGYQISILTAGFLLSDSLDGYYAIYGVILLFAALFATLLPPVRGHQHGAKKVPLTVFLKNRSMLLVLALVFIAQLAAQFFNAFFTKYMGDLGISNSMVGIITTLTVVMEIPFLLFIGDKLLKKMSVFRFMWIGLVINGLRFFALSYARSPMIILLTQLPSVALFACFEFYPSLYLSTIVDKELLSSAQSVYQAVSFGLARILGASLGGLLAEAMGIAAVFRMSGAMLLAVSLFTFIPLFRKRT